jgi:hypothetical protein
VQTSDWDEVWSKVVALIKKFSTVCCTPPAHEEIGGDSRLLVVGSQITNLILNPSFGHNLCLKCPNGSWKPILDIYVPKDFQWCKELLNSLIFDLFNHSLKIWESTRTPIPKVKAPLVHSFTLSYAPKSMRCDSHASLLGRNLANPCFGCKPKARVVTPRLGLQ